jgi:DNA (cytosine-5)-methyltransferase 1
VRSTDGERGGRGDLIQAIRGNPNSHYKTWPTPHGFSPDGRTNGPSGNELGRAVNQSPWPTPTVACANGGQTSRSGKRKGELLLAGAVKAFPTPRTPSKSGGGTGLDGGAGSRSMLTEQERKELCGGSLNPTWVEWLMGWPLGWTDSAQSATDRFRQWSASHGISSDRF